MLFRRLEIKNFLCFYDANVIDFPDPFKTDTSLILLIGPNSAGKSNVIRSLKFLFYGDLMNHSENEAYNLVNDRHREESKSQEIEGYVRATICKNDQTITFQRTIVLSRSGKEWRLKECHLAQVSRDAQKGDVFHEDAGQIAREIDRVVPRELFDYFYFKGEDITKTLLLGAATQVESGIEKLLHLDDWDTAIDTVHDVQRWFAQQRSRAGALNADYVAAESALSFSKEELHRREKSLKDYEGKKKTLEGELQLLTTQLSELTKGTSHEVLAEKYRKAKQRCEVAKQEIKKVDSDLARHLGQSAGLPFLVKTFPLIEKLLEKMCQDNLLPADLSAGFVARLIERQVCICDRPLDKSSEDACKAVVAYRDRSLSSKMNATLLTLQSRLKESSALAYKKDVKNIVALLDGLIKRRTGLFVEEKEAQEEEKEARTALEEAKVIEIQNVAKSFRDCQGKAEQYARATREDEIAIKTQLSKIRDAQKLVEKLKPKAATPELSRIARCLHQAELLESLIKESREILEKTFRTTMQKSVSGYYNGNMTDSSEAFVDAETLLPYVKTATGEKRSMTLLGDGQQQLLALAYIFSLCQLRKTLHAQLMDIGIGVGHLDDQSFFLDSIFAPTDKGLAAKTAALLPGKAHQIVLLVASQQWYDEVRSAIEPAVTKVYRLHIHSTNKARDEKEFQMPFRKKMISTMSVIKQGLGYTRIEEVK